MLSGLSIRGRRGPHLRDDLPLGGRPASARAASLRSRLRRLSGGQAALLALLALLLLRAVWNQRGAAPTPRRALVAPEAAPDAAAAAARPRELLLSSHGRLQWLDVATGRTRLLHEGRGVYYGVAPEPASASAPAGNVWVVSRPHNWRAPPEGSREAALLLDGRSGALLRDVPLPTQFTHDMVRLGDKMYVADTGHGSVWELALPDLSVVRELQLFTAKEHINSLAVWPGEGGAAEQLWAVLHNLGPSQLVRIDLASGEVAQRFTRVGDKSHCLSLWRGKALMLSSGEGSLIAVDLAAAAAAGDAYAPQVLWTDPGRTFMKGLTVIEDVAYIGISAFGTRRERDDTAKTSEVAAIDLGSNTLLWRVTVETKGLLNIVSAPHLSPLSTSVALPSWQPASDSATPAVVLTEAGDPAGPGATAQGVASKRFQFQAWNAHGEQRPRNISLSAKRAISRLDPKAYPDELLGEAAFVSLRHVDVGPLVAAVHSAAREGLWDAEKAERENAVLGGRAGNMQRFKPGTQTAHLVFSSQDARSCYHFPYWEETWRAPILPLLQEVMGWYGVPPAEAESRIVRLQFARMGPGGAILKHADKGGWAMGLHRVHIPLITNPDVEFLMQSDREGSYVAIPVAPGDVFEINNAVPHEVHNSKSEERVHLLLDFAEAPLECGHLKRGQHCEYANQQGIIC